MHNCLSIALFAWVKVIVAFTSQDVDLLPAIAMNCGKITQYRDLVTGEWTTDFDGQKNCMTSSEDMLSYCRKVYPSVTFIAVKQQDVPVKIKSWCSLGHRGPKCRGHPHAVKPVQCLTAESDDLDPICKQPMKVGLCRAAFPLWYYNVKTGACESFIYGGCGGNENRFNSEDECKSRCHPTVTNSQFVADPLLIMEVGPEIPEPETTTEATTANAIAETETQRSGEYFALPLNPSSEHEMYSNALLKELHEHQSKLSSLIQEFNSAKQGLVDQRASHEKFTEARNNYDQEIAALQKEHQTKREQLNSVHRARLDAGFANARDASYQALRNAVNNDTILDKQLIRAFKRYLHDEQKNQRHTSRRLQTAIENNSKDASGLQQKLNNINDNVNNALNLVKHRLSSSDSWEQLDELAANFNSATTTTASPPEEPIWIDRGGLPAENTDYRVPFDDIDSEPSFDIDRDFSVETPLPLFPKSFSDHMPQFGDPDPQDDYVDDDVDDEKSFRSSALRSSVNDWAYPYNEKGWLVWLGVAGVVVFVVVLASVAIYRVHRNHSSRAQFARVEVEDQLTPEERQLLQMQQNGYENPTYKFFEKQQQA